MALTDAVRPAPLDPGRIAGCMALSAEAGWNQTASDWSLFLEHGSVLGIADEDGWPVATGATLPYPGGFAWISMVLVTESRRHRRLGTEILTACMADLHQRGLIPVLDATPAGERVYRPLGFEPVFGLTRWQGEGGGSCDRQASFRSMEAGDLPAVIAADAEAFGAERAFLLESFFGRAPASAFVTDDCSGFVLARPGRLATQVGPLVAPDERTAGILLETALGSIAGPVFLDLADRWSGLSQQLQARAFTVQRPFLRMARHRSSPFGRPQHLFAAAGPEFG